MAAPDARFALAPYDFAAAAALSAELGVSHVLAQVLVRRGLAEPAAAREFLNAEVRHPLGAFGGLAKSAEIVLGHVRSGSRITVHGDYDVDGAASTAILVRALRTLGARVDWFLPSRAEDGYGLAMATVERLAARGTSLLVTVDCGITALDEVARAKALGMEVVVTDHHTPRADGLLPDADALVHPRLGGGNPCGDLCAAGVAYKLAGALLEAAGQDPAYADEDLDLVALATVADVVPLHDENRALVRAGLRALRATRKPGLRALMEVSRVDPSGLNAASIGFRLAPRLNAAGRVARADAALELLITEDEDRARAVADELDGLNALRRDLETRILFAAEAQVREAGEQAAYVLVGEDWHPGVIGIVASRIAERRCRPTVLIALDGDEGTGSGRSIPPFDLLGGFDSGARHLLRHGGHRAAAGLTIRREDVDAFREAFCAHAAEVLSPEDLVPVERVDAVVSGDALGLGLAEELARLEPFGAGNPAVSLLVPAAELSDPRALGDSGRHVGFRLTSGGVRSRGVRFGDGLTLPDGAVDACVRLEINAFNGSVEPRVLLRRARRCELGIERVGEPAFAAGVLSELDADLQQPNPSRLTHTESLDGFVRDVRGAGVVGVIADLVATGEPVLVVCAHAAHRANALRGRVGGFALTTWAELDEVASNYTHLVALDPPAFSDAVRQPGAGYTHLAWGPGELTFAQAIHEWEHTLLDPMRDLYRRLRAAPVAGAEAEALLRGSGRQPHTPVLAGRLVRVLRDLGLVTLDADGFGLRAVPSPRVDPSRSPSYVAYGRRRQEGHVWLTSPSLPKAA